MIRLRVLAVVAVLGAWCGVVPAQAAAASTLRGTAGTWVAVTVPHDLVLGWQLKEVQDLAASRGSFVGFSLVDAFQTDALTYVVGRHSGRSCAFARVCDIYDWPGVTGMRQDDAGFHVPAGRYRFVLLGEPGASVSLRSTFGFLRGVARTTDRGRLAVQSLASTVPAAGDAQPLADGATSFEGSGASVTGVVFRLDTDIAKEATADLCVGSGPQPVPHVVVCDTRSGGASEGAGVMYVDCSQPVPGVMCLPLSGGPDSVTHGIGALVNGAGAHASFDLDVKAVKSRVWGWAFSFRF